jgi:hypothetical protein
MEILVFGDDDEVVLMGVIPDRAITGAAKPDVTDMDRARIQI